MLLTTYLLTYLREGGNEGWECIEMDDGGNSHLGF
jgi:hypothetical protein